MKIKNIGLICSGIALLFALGVAHPGSVYGDNKKERAKLYVTNLPIKLGNVSEGYVYQGELKLVEHNGIPVNVKVYTTSMSMSPIDYKPEYESSPKSYRNTLQEWVTFPEGTTHTVEGKQSLDVPFTVTIPKNALGGSQYCALMVERVVPEDEPLDPGVNTRIDTRIAVPIFADIQGADAHTSGEILSWNTNRFFLAPPLKSNFVIENTGNIIFDIDYKYEIFDVFGSNKESVYTDEGTGQVFPESKRTVYHEWPGAPYLGLFNVKETITFNGKSEEFHCMVLIIPLWFALIILLVIVLTIIGLILKIKKSKKSKKPISSRDPFEL